MILALFACAKEPGPAEAWHGAVRVESVRRAEGACDPGGDAIEPIAPWLFVAVLDGEPPLSSLYWCETPETCPPAPFATVDVDRLTAAALEGASGTWLRAYEECEVRWDTVEATRDGDRISLVWRTYQALTEVAGDAECEASLDDAFEVDCDSVLTVEGVRE